ncbi:MAG: hypothetical protein HN855_12265 [Anaerolineae bacterium]|jgi:leader peptidase (prepilin peptidase) / N-methyltransferase|nr:hypothetical protein [Anaerolineae bacterium]MBT7071304.1 hypothetical protein [Anaerolineae bacterium]MBT7325928.1 hypothetical protein [Anaerolineae bacterium]
MNISIVVPLLLGWVAALLVNYLADVLPATRQLTSPPCKQCSAKFAWTNYLLLKSCSACEKPRATRTWVTQVLGLIASLYIWFSPPNTLGYWLGLLLLVYLAVVFIIDLEHRLILHPTSIFGAILALGLGIFLHGLKETLLGGLAGYGIMYALYGFGVLFTKFRAKRMIAAGLEPDDEDALGFGDVNLAGILGLLLGWPIIWFGLLLGILAGGAVSLIIVIAIFIQQRYQKDALMIFIPYGPYFILSTFILLYLPHWITSIL